MLERELDRASDVAIEAVTATAMHLRRIVGACLHGDGAGGSRSRRLGLGLSRSGKRFAPVRSQQERSA
jgi:hypothetical protein